MLLPHNAMYEYKYLLSPLLRSVVRHVAIVLMLAWSLSARSQYYVSGQDPARIHWRQMSTPKFVLIYPDYLEYKIQELRAYCDTFAYYNYLEMDMPFAKSQTKTPIVFHSVGSYSNGMNAWAPKRIEMWTMPPQNTYSQQWLQQLMLHEYRHELQMEALNQSGVGVLTSIFGQHIVGAIAGIMVPMWYLEGDATWAETILSFSGRGRQGSFVMPYRALLSKKKPYSYSKAVFGSYKDYVPNQYMLGYLMVARDRITNTNYWKEGFQSVASKFWTLRPMYMGNFVDYYDSTMTFWNDNWKSYNNNISSTAQTLTPLSNKYSSYIPAAVHNKNIVALKTSFDHRTALITIDSAGNEHITKYLSNVYDAYFASHNNMVAYIEVVPDKRWNVQYNNLVVYNLDNGKKQTLTKHRNIFSPAFSKSGKLAALEVSDTLITYLLVFDSAFYGQHIADNMLQKKSLSKNNTANPANLDNPLTFFGEDKQMQRIALPNQYEYSYPAWNEGQDSVYMIVVAKQGGAAIGCYSLLDSTFNIVSEYTYASISHLKVYDSLLYYIADYEGVPQVFSYNITTHKTHQNTMAEYGVGNYIIHNNNIIYSDYTVDGYALSVDSVRYMPFTISAMPSVLPHISYADIPPLIGGDSSYCSKKYNKITHLFDFHSWAPLSISPSEKEVDLGASVFSQNVLGTSLLSAGWQFDHNNNSNKYYLDYEYSGWYPVINIGASFQNHHYNMADTATMLYSQLYSYVAATMPFNYYEDGHGYNFSLSAQLAYNAFFENNNDYYIPNIALLNAQAVFTHYTEKPYQYIFNPWLQSVSLSWLNGLNYTNTIFSIATQLYFPSPIRTHSIRLYGAWQYVDDNGVVANSSIRVARGFNFFNPSMLNISLAANYTFPFLYPDLNVWNIMYFKRFYANIFADYMKITNNDYYSLGMELYANMNVFQISTPISLGIRMTYLPQFKDLNYDFLFNIEI